LEKGAQIAKQLFALIFFPTAFRQIHDRKILNFAEGSRFFLFLFCQKYGIYPENLKKCYFATKGHKEPPHCRSPPLLRF